MLKVLETKSERVEHELRSNPDRSDREIARICGVSHHTVGRRRNELGLVGNFGGENAQLGSLFAQENCPPLQDCPPGTENCPENCPGVEKEAENSPPDQEEASQSVTCDNASSAETVLLPAQGEITIGWNKDGGMILRPIGRTKTRLSSSAATILTCSSIVSPMRWAFRAQRG